MVIDDDEDDERNHDGWDLVGIVVTGLSSKSLTHL